MSLVREAAGSNLAELRVIDQYDAYYLDRLREKPLPVIYARITDEGRHALLHRSEDWTDSGHL